MTQITVESMTPTLAPAPTPGRGVTDIADRVVERIAGRAAGEVPEVLPAPATGIRRLAAGAAQDAPSVDVHVDGATVSLTIRLAVSYPAPIRAVARRVQDAVRTRVQDLTGLAVTAVRVEVAAAPIASADSRRVV